VRIESLVVFVLLGGSACSLLAPSDGELSGSWGVGGVHAFGDGGQSNRAGRASGGDTGGNEPTPNGGSADAGDSGSDGGASDGGGSAGSTSAGRTGAIAGSGGKPGAGGASGGGASGGGAGGTFANGGTISSSGGKSGAGGAGSGGKGGGAGGAGSGGKGGGAGGAGSGGKGGGGGGAGGAAAYCSPNPCVRGTCSEVSNGYKCTCPAGWGGTTCAVGSCSTLSCPASAPCTVPASNVAAVCYPSACVGNGLCMAENVDGSGTAIIIDGHNTDFNPLSGSNWTNRAKYFVYINDLHGPYACVFPQPSDTGTPLVIPVNSVRTKAAGFGQSNSWPNPPTCSYP